MGNFAERLWLLIKKYILLAKILSFVIQNSLTICTLHLDLKTKKDRAFFVPAMMQARSFLTQPETL
jgi:hypothetical protein